METNVKKILSILTISVLAVSILARVSFIFPLDQKESNIATKIPTNLAKDEFYYYNSNQSSWLIYNENKQLASHHYYRTTFSIAAAEFESYSYVNFYDPDHESFSQVSWGNGPYYGNSVRKWAPVAISSIRVGNINDSSVDWHQSAKKWATSLFLKVDDRSWLARFAARQALGFSYIPSYKGTEKIYEFSIFGYQLTEYGDWAISGGSSWTNLGKGLVFSK